jgi:hypothetical protein
MDQDEKCWQCGRAIKTRKFLARMLDEDQSVFVGPDCAKLITKRGTIEAAKGTFLRAVIEDPS